MIDDELFEKAHEATCGKGFTVKEGARHLLEYYLLHLPKPSMPYDQAIAYRKLAGME